MADGIWLFVDNLTINMAGYLTEYPLASQGAVALTLAAGCAVILAVPTWASHVASDKNLAETLCLSGFAAGACLFLTGLIYESLLMGSSSVISCMPLVHIYYAACNMVSWGAMVFAGFEIFRSLRIRPSSVMRAAIPGLLGAWLFALSIPVYQFAQIPRG